MVFDLAGNKHVGSGGKRGAARGARRSRAGDDGPYRAIEAPPHARRTAEHAGAACGKLAERHLLGGSAQLAVALLGAAGLRLHHAAQRQPQHAGQHALGASGNVEGGMEVHKRHAPLNGAIHHGAGIQRRRRGRLKRRGRRQISRVMRDEHVRARIGGRVDGAHRGVERHGHRTHRCRRIAHQKARAVPFLGVGCRKLGKERLLERAYRKLEALGAQAADLHAQKLGLAFALHALFLGTFDLDLLRSHVHQVLPCDEASLGTARAACPGRAPRRFDGAFAAFTLAQSGAGRPLRWEP